MTRNLLILVFLASLLTGGCGGGEQNSTSRESDTLATIESGEAADLKQPIPSFSEPTLSGDTLRTEDLVGQVTLVNFWATWCGPCIVETPELVGLREEWKERPFEVVGISMDSEGFEVVEPFAREFGITYPLILDDGPLADEFGGVYGLPTTFVVDAEGTIVQRFMGVFPFDEMREELDRMIREAG